MFYTLVQSEDEEEKKWTEKLNEWMKSTTEVQHQPKSCRPFRSVYFYRLLWSQRNVLCVVRVRTYHSQHNHWSVHLSAASQSITSCFVVCLCRLSLSVPLSARSICYWSDYQRSMAFYHVSVSQRLMVCACVSCQHIRYPITELSNHFVTDNWINRISCVLSSYLFSSWCASFCFVFVFVVKFMITDVLVCFSD